MESYFIYILTNKDHRVLYVGVTNDLSRRVAQHQNSEGGRFTARYRAKKLVYFEQFSSPQEAIYREKEIKGWKRQRKIALIQGQNPEWNDLAQWI